MGTGSARAKYRNEDFTMKELLSNLYNLILQIANNENYINIISIVVVAFTSYHIAQYNASKPEKLKIKQLQFSNVYLPLFRILSELPSEPTLSQATEIHEKILVILDKHYELAFPQLHELNAKLNTSIMDKHDYQKILACIKHQVEVDYELLKKSLGYPSKNFYNIFIRMTTKQKAEFIVSWLNFSTLIGILIGFCVAMTLYTENAAFIFFSALAISIIYICLAIKLSEWVHNMKD